ncbi:MAG: citrate transporter, partial [Oscillospiraceae bacterium]|nr:citrate transporter [Oscillospiraceae bacterium]
LLGTFFFFFIFSGNLARIDAVNAFFSSLLEKDALIVSTLSCQFISNVPTAILLSQFTEDYHSLLLGVNIGGTGTLIASLASLITFSEFKILYPGQVKKYLLLFTLINVIFLVVMTVAAKLFFL